MCSRKHYWTCSWKKSRFDKLKSEQRQISSQLCLGGVGGCVYTSKPLNVAEDSNIKQKLPISLKLIGKLEQWGPTFPKCHGFTDDFKISHLLSCAHICWKNIFVNTFYKDRDKKKNSRGGKYRNKVTLKKEKWLWDKETGTAYYLYLIHRSALQGTTCFYKSWQLCIKETSFFSKDPGLLFEFHTTEEKGPISLTPRESP